MDLMGMAQLMGNFGEFFGAIAVGNTRVSDYPDERQH